MITSRYPPTYANHGKENTPRNKTFLAVPTFNTLDFDGKQTGVCQEINLKHSVVWLLVWNGTFKKQPG